MASAGVDPLTRGAPVRMASDIAAARIMTVVPGALLVLGLFGRIMTFPLSHDEQIHVAAARLIFHQPLYGALGYNHLPGLPLLLGGIYALTGTTHLLLAGRLMIFLCWLATAGILWMFASRHGGGSRVAIVAMLVLGAGVLLDPPGMAVTNNFLPMPFALFGVHLLILALGQDRVRTGLLFLAGTMISIAVVMKVSFVFLLPPVAVVGLVVPGALPLRERLFRVVLPLMAGGILGGLPALVVLASDPQMLLAHTVRYFTAGHLAYWEHSAAPKAISVAAKVQIAQDVWLSGSGLLAGMLAGGFAWIVACRDVARLRWWPIPFLVATIGIGALLSFAPSPAFPQYYEPPVPFLILLFILLHRQLGEEARLRARPWLGTAAVLAFAMMFPKLVTSLPALAHPARWTGMVAHAEGMELRQALARQGERGKIATLQPIVALEGGLPIYRAFGAGPFVYRVADYLPPADRGLYTTTSPRELPAFLDGDPPAAIVTGREAEFDPAFVAYAVSRGYAPVGTGDADARIFIRPATRPTSLGDNR